MWKLNEHKSWLNLMNTYWIYGDLCEQRNLFVSRIREKRRIFLIEKQLHVIIPKAIDSFAFSLNFNWIVNWYRIRIRNAQTTTVAWFVNLVSALIYIHTQHSALINLYCHCSFIPFDCFRKKSNKKDMKFEMIYKNDSKRAWAQFECSNGLVSC